MLYVMTRRRAPAGAAGRPAHENCISGPATSSRVRSGSHDHRRAFHSIDGSRTTAGTPQIHCGRYILNPDHHHRSGPAAFAARSSTTTARFAELEVIRAVWRLRTIVLNSESWEVRCEVLGDDCEAAGEDQHADHYHEHARHHLDGLVVLPNAR